ncbi:hypothetical protein DEJ44_31360 [Streptomyces venezuelae]|nr:hypothetical protein DEJ44_31360 [Streptomyces venezuelae]
MRGWRRGCPAARAPRRRAVPSPWRPRTGRAANRPRSSRRSRRRARGRRRRRDPVPRTGC